MSRFTRPARQKAFSWLACINLQLPRTRLLHHSRRGRCGRSPQIKDAHGQQDQRSRKNMQRRQNPPSRSRGGQMKVVDEPKDHRPGNVPGQHKSRACHQQREPSGTTALGPQHGAGRNRQHQQFSVIKMMMNGQHGKNRNGCQSQPCSLYRGTRSQRDKKANMQQRSTY